MHKTLGVTVIALALAPTTLATADTVIPDDLIVQGSACIGLDCVNNEPFGFDTIRLKENNTRIHFQDTSTGSFPNHNWQLTANDSASGGLNKFSIENLTAARVPFTIVGAAPTNSVFVADTGKVGLRTAAPLLDLHIKTSDTPAQRLEQDNSGGFTAQTWDIGGNEANFFVRDLTSGSRLPLRIRPGAPTSSIDVSPVGDVGIGVSSPSARLHVSGGGIIASGAFPTTVASTGGFDYFTTGMRFFSMGASGSTKGTLTYVAKGADGSSITPFFVSDTGQFGIGTTTPAAQLHTTGSVRFAGLTSCNSLQTSGQGDLLCVPSSRQFKNITGDLAPQVALANIMALRPQTGSYKTTPDVPEHWFIAEEVAEVDPALAGLKDGKPYLVKTQNVVADLVAVVQQQQREIAEQRREIAELRRMIAAK